MRNRMRWVAVVMFSVIVGAGAAALFSTPASAASSCWKVDCNTCCRTPGGGVICTQRLCA